MISDGPAIDFCPAEVLNRRPGRAPYAVRAWTNPAVRALHAITAHNAREYVAQQNAIDAPFQEMAKERFFAGVGSCSSASRDVLAARSAAGAAGGATELDPFKTMQTTPLREVVELDVYQSRVRRLRKAVGNSAHVLHADAHTNDSWQRWRPLFVTLTYRDVKGWKPSDIRAFGDQVRKWFLRKCGKTRMRMVWVLELQKRGAVHYHCLIWVRSKDYFPNPAAAGWWPHGFSHVKGAGKDFKIARPVAYMAKYASKVSVEQAMSVPKGARMYGVCGATAEGKRVIRYWRAPTFVRDQLPGTADIRKVRGGYMDKITGEFLASPWKVMVSPGGRVFAWREIPPQSLEISA
jgi:hypothetical protein